ncbi:MAG: type II secretion system F family protein [Aquihabitans sp.]
MNRRYGRLAFAGAVFVTLLSVLVGPAAVAQDRTGLLTVRGIDPTDPKAVDVTILWTGEPNDLQKLVLREDGQAVKVDSLLDLSKTDTHLGTVVVVDLSGSMGDDGALASAKSTIAGMAKNLPDGDQMAVVSFTNDAAVETPFTSDPAQIQAALDAMAAPRDGRTAMYDGIRQAVTLLGTRPNLQPNILLITDGADDVSKSTLNETRAAVKRSGAALFALELTHEDQVDTKAINSIIDQSGGAAFGGSSKAEIAKAFTELTTTMRSQFVATYASKATQGSVGLTVSVGGQEVERSFVAGNVALGAQAAPVVLSEKAFGPSWMHGSTGALLALLCVGVGLGLGVYALISLATKNETGLQAVLSPYSEGGPGMAGDDADQSMAQTALLQRAVDMTEGFAERQGFLEKIENMLERADLPLRAAEALFFYVAAVILLGLASLLLFGLVLGLMTIVLLALLPLAVLSFLANRRGKKFVGQLPDTLNLLSGSLRAGYSLMQGVEAVSQEVSEPMGKELRRVITEARLGRDLEDSMDAVAERMSSLDFSWAVMAIRIQREVGGNLSELLLTVADTMVQRDRLRRDVSALTAEGRISAGILALLPVGLGAFMWIANPEYMNPLIDTGLGQAMLGLSILAAIIGFIWMKKTITIEI